MLKKIACLILAGLLALAAGLPVLAREGNPDVPLTLILDNSGGQSSKFSLYAQLPMTEEILDTITSVVVWYSLDGTDFSPLRNDFGEARDISFGAMMRNGVFYEVCLYPYEYPLRAFQSGKLERFWLKLYIEGGVYEGFTTPALLEYDETTAPLPEKYKTEAMFPESMITVERDPEGALVFTATQNIILPQGMTAAAVRALLPSSIPMTVQVLEAANSAFCGIVAVPYAVAWKLPDDLDRLPAGAYIFKQDAVLIAPSEPVSIKIGIHTYTFAPPQTSRAALNLAVTITPDDRPPTVIAPPADEETTYDGSGGNRGNAGNHNTGSGGDRTQQTQSPTFPETERSAKENQPTVPSAVSQPHSRHEEETYPAESAEPEQSAPGAVYAQATPQDQSGQPARLQPFRRTGLLLAAGVIAVAALAGIAAKTGVVKKHAAKRRPHR